MSFPMINLDSPKQKVVTKSKFVSRGGTTTFFPTEFYWAYVRSRYYAETSEWKEQNRNKAPNDSIPWERI